MDLLYFKKIWQDTEFFEVELFAQSSFAMAKTNSYTDSNKINQLSSKLLSFTSNDKYLWENGVKGNEYAPFVSLYFESDCCGHVNIEIYAEINDGGTYDKHNCCFFINSELGLLYKFGKNLKLLISDDIGVKISLNE